MNLITIDIGNSTITTGLWRGSHLEVRSLPLVELPAESSEKLAVLQGLFRNIMAQLDKPLNGIIISSVAPSLTGLFFEIAQLFSRHVLIMHYRLDTGLIFGIPEPAKTGTDRIAAAAGAYDEFREPLVIADLGSATTLTVVGRGGVYLGGAILPGVNMMARALHTETAQLPEVEPLIKGLSPVGRETLSAINSGIIYGTAGAIERLKAEFEKELGYRLLLITTGGKAPLIEPYIKADHRRPYLVLEGLRLVFERNFHA